MSVLLLFVDGVGLGPHDAASNPFVRANALTLHRLLDGPLTFRGIVDRPPALLVPADATLGVPGLPQSATGQTALLTGINAAALAGRHVTAYPTEALRALLAAESLFARLRARGRRAALANAYTPEYFAAVAERRLKVAAVTYAAQAAGMPLRSVDDLRSGRAVFHDLTNGRLRQWGYDLPEITPRDAGGTLAAIASTEDVTVFEFFLTDLAAHGRIPLTTEAAVEMVDALLGGVLDAARPEMTVIMTSDHGNLEDDRSHAHTTNPVPVLAIGPGRDAFRGVQAITEVAPAILGLVGIAAAVDQRAAGGTA